MVAHSATIFYILENLNYNVRNAVKFDKNNNVLNFTKRMKTINYKLCFVCVDIF